jgi:hypothetical protein
MWSYLIKEETYGATIMGFVGFWNDGVCLHADTAAFKSIRTLELGFRVSMNRNTFRNYVKFTYIALYGRLRHSMVTESWENIIIKRDSRHVGKCYHSIWMVLWSATSTLSQGGGVHKVLDPNVSFGLIGLGLLKSGLLGVCFRKLLFWQRILPIDTSKWP